MRWTRRRFLSVSTIGSAAVARRLHGGPVDGSRRLGMLFVSKGRTGKVHVDGSGLSYLPFDEPHQVSWQPSVSSQDGRSTVFLSMEARRDGPGRPFEDYYHQTPTRLWLWNHASGAYREICQKDRIAPFYSPCLLVDEDRILVQVVRRGGGRVYSMNLDGTNARAFTGEADGLPYGFSLSPDGSRVAYHLASPNGYQVWTSDTRGDDRRFLAGHPDHLYFGTAWSTDGKWVTYCDCHFRQDPGHDWADVCVGRSDGSEHRVITQGQSMWFGATYGNLENRGGGSNIPTWSPEGRVVYPRRIPGSKVAWEYRAGRADDDHFNREYKPKFAKGGTSICLVDPADRSEQSLTPVEPGSWDFRASCSPDGRFVLFCRAKTGGLPSLWVIESDGSNPRLITAGPGDQGVDHPRWAYF